MIVKDIIKLLDDKYPFCYAEDYDNIGLIIGDEQNKVKGILVCLDAIECIIDEAIEKNKAKYNEEEDAIQALRASKA